ncbi:alpha/beta fold hydrolase [Colwelliaceae bacterium MEBiC 14330]
MISAQFTQEADLKGKLPKQVSQLWQRGVFSSFSGISGAKIHYAAILQDNSAAPCLVIVPGRSESYLKYQELSFDLYSQGYHIFIIDHRGQGLSERLLNNGHKGYVASFQDYVDDLAQFIENIVQPHCTAKPYILAHSMGGAIATRYLQQHSTTIKAAVISSPMLGFNAGIIPHFFVKGLIDGQIKLNRLFNQEPWYFLGQSNYSAIDFSRNKLSHSKNRYQIFSELYQKNQTIQLGGVTGHWLAESLLAQQKIFQNLAKLETPILLLQAGSDSIVCQQAQDDFCQQLHNLKPMSCPNGQPFTISNAYHELFFEIDAYRTPALEQTLAWFHRHK